MRISPISTWFRPKRVGIGWTPARWEGWVATIVGAGLIVGLIQAF